MIWGRCKFLRVGEEVGVHLSMHFAFLCLGIGDVVRIVINPFTPKSDQCQISPAASPEILHHAVWRTWLFIAYSDKK